MPRGESPWADISDLISRELVSVIFDVGANVGQTARELAAVYPTASVYSFEPVPSTFSILQENLKGVDRVRCFPYGFSDRVWRKEIFVQAESVWNSVSKNVDRDLGTEHVQLVTLDGFCADLGIRHINVIKTDTEGHDLDVLKGARRMLAESRVDAVYSEVGFYREDVGHAYYCDLLEYLQSMGFQFWSFYGLDGIRFIDHGVEPCYPWTNALFVRNAFVQAADDGKYSRWLDSVASRRAQKGSET